MMLLSMFALSFLQITHALGQGFSKRVVPRRVSVGMSALKLYGNQGTRSPLVNWYLLTVTNVTFSHQLG